MKHGFHCGSAVEDESAVADGGQVGLQAVDADGVRIKVHRFGIHARTDVDIITAAGDIHTILNRPIVRNGEGFGRSRTQSKNDRQQGDAERTELLHEISLPLLVSQLYSI